MFRGQFSNANPGGQKLFLRFKNYFYGKSRPKRSKTCHYCNTSMTTLMTITVPILVTKEISITILTTITITLTKPLSGNQGFFVGIVFNPALPKEVCHHHSLQACTQAHILTFKYIGEKFMLVYAHYFWSN